MEGPCLAREREESDAILPDRSVQSHSVRSLETERSLANGPSWPLVGEEGVLREKYVFCVPRDCSVSYLFFVYGRSLWAGA